MRKSMLLAMVTVIAIIIIFTILLIGCQNTDAVGKKYYLYVEGHPEASFIYIPRTGNDYRLLIYNEKTKVMYMAPANGNLVNELTLIVDENGYPARFEE